jgi:hypothetical protein
MWRSRHFANKRKDKINKLAMNSKNKNTRGMYRGINEFRRGYHHVRWDPCPHSMARPRVADGGTASRYGG